MSQTPGPASPWCFHSTSGDVCKLAHRLGADAGACPQAMSGDELNTLQYFSLLAAARHAVDERGPAPRMVLEGSSTDDLNRLSGWLGVMRQSNGGSDEQTNPRESNLLTAEHVGAHAAHVAPTRQPNWSAPGHGATGVRHHQNHEGRSPRTAGRPRRPRSLRGGVWISDCSNGLIG